MNKKIKIALVTGFSTKQPAGLERYLVDILRSFEQNQWLAGNLTVYTEEKVSSNLAAETSLSVLPVKGGMFWKDLGLFFAPKAEVYLFNGPLIPILFTPKKSVVIVYDFAYKYFSSPGWRNRIKYRFIDIISYLAFKRATSIVCISETTKGELIKFFSVDSDKIKVIYPGFNDVCCLSEFPIPNLGSFFLFVGTVKERKNVLGVINAFVLFNRRQSAYRLVVAGKYDSNSEYGKKIQAVIERENIKDKVLFLGHITDNQLSYLYHHAVALVFPSLLEGFGFPIIEAMNCGLPVITADQGCLKEVGGKAALLADPNDYTALAGAMEKIVVNRQLCQDLKENGLKHAANFSWRKTANEFSLELDKILQL
jgi:glycosyltransferase involved in cell wall biosynthesis